MIAQQDRWVLGALALSESAWIFAAAGVVGAAAQRDGSPLGRVGVFAVLGAAILVGRLAPSRVAAIEVVHLVRAIIGLAVVYLVVGSQVSPGTSGIDVAWIAGLWSNNAPDGFMYRAVGGSVLAGLLWWRGSLAAASEYPSDTLSFSFRLGILAVAFSLTVDALNPADLQSFLTMFIFFASALGGLVVGHLMPESERAVKAGTWPKIIAGLVSVVVAVGLVVALIRKDVLSIVSNPAVDGLFTAVTGAFWAVVAPISLAFTAFVDGLISFFDHIYDPEPGDIAAGEAQSEQLLTQAELDTLVQEEQESGALFFVIQQIIEWAFLAVVTIVLLYILFSVIRRLLKALPDTTDGLRESVGDEANIGSDLARLLWKLTPERLRRRRGRSLRVPSGPPGIVDVFKVYYRLLSMAEKQGVRRAPHETANEFQGALEGTLPPDLVRTATRSFNGACYGDHPATQEQISWMRSYLTRLAAGPG